MRIVFGVSFHPETEGEHFPILEVEPGESDEAAIKRAQALYYNPMKCIIKET